MRGDGGFSILEVLIALAIASIAALAVTALFQVTTRASAAVVLSDRVNRALLQLQEIIDLAGSDRGLEVAGIANVITLAAPPSHDPEKALRLQLSDGNLVVNEPRLLTANLSAFDTIRWEYLTQTNKHPVWRDEAADLREVLGMRLILTLASRQWRPLVWLASVPDARVTTP